MSAEGLLMLDYNCPLFLCHIEIEHSTQKLCDQKFGVCDKLYCTAKSLIKNILKSIVQRMRTETNKKNIDYKISFCINVCASSSPLYLAYKSFVALFHYGLYLITTFFISFTGYSNLENIDYKISFCINASKNERSLKFSIFLRIDSTFALQKSEEVEVMSWYDI
uniref:Uncharacterized protein n=1 Tax=Glossina austeni TaxID=7395 RepID=A0A1A9VVC7_GLOAU